MVVSDPLLFRPYPYPILSASKLTNATAWGAYSYAGDNAEPRKNPYITMLGHPFATPVPLFVSAGTSELFFARICRWATEMREVKGNTLELYLENDAVHDTYFVGQLMGFEDSAWKVADQVAKFVEGL